MSSYSISNFFTKSNHEHLTQKRLGIHPTSYSLLEFKCHTLTLGHGPGPLVVYNVLWEEFSKEHILNQCSHSTVPWAPEADGGTAVSEEQDVQQGERCGFLMTPTLPHGSIMEDSCASQQRSLPKTGLHAEPLHRLEKCTWIKR